MLKLLEVDQNLATIHYIEGLSIGYISKQENVEKNPDHELSVLR